MNNTFINNKEKLIAFAIQKWNAHAEMIKWIELQNKEGLSKTELYEVFIELFKHIQIDDRTKNDDKIYEALTEFLDGFTYLGKNFRILPNEPNL